MAEMVGVEAFEQLFGPVRGQFEPKFSKNSNARGFPGGGGMLKLRFDWYIMLIEHMTHLRTQNPYYIRDQ